MGLDRGVGVQTSGHCRRQKDVNKSMVVRKCEAAVDEDAPDWSLHRAGPDRGGIDVLVKGLLAWSLP